MEVKIEKLDNFGRGITYINDKICFVVTVVVLVGVVVVVVLFAGFAKFFQSSFVP